MLQRFLCRLGDSIAPPRRSVDAQGAVVQSRAGGACFNLDGGLMASEFPESRDQPRNAFQIPASVR